MRLNLTLDDDHAALLVRLAESAHVQPGTLARSMLLTALERSSAVHERSAEPLDMLDLLNAIPGALDRVEVGRAEIAAGRGVPLSDL